ncbi:MAG TPA: crosslink repair DNA glycosylase YcaQ family protein [Clostridia bacterium]|nr:crosslink repair DNA glycosylase YcaQ family protein [Clostridia bacterium]
MEEIIITKQQARQFLLTYQGLMGKRMFSGKQGITDYIGKVGCIQFDPLNIVGHNHELVLQSRIRNFKPDMLQRLLYKERKLIDGWDKNMSIYCTEDWPYFRRLREAARQRLGRSDKPIENVLPQIRSEIKERGPVSSTDLDYPETVDWFWAPARMSRAALESMYFWGELIIHHKAYTRRIYDFAYRNLPEELLSAPDPNPTDGQYFAWYVQRRISGIGMLWNKAGDAWLGIEGLKSKERNEAFELLLKEGRIVEIFVQDIKYPMYINSEYKQLLYSVLDGRQPEKHASIMAPLDNLLWDRKLILELFGFDYRWEVYKPVSERSYGYYVLPVLYGDRFIARFEPGWDKKTNTLLVKNWWWEPEVKLNKRLKEVLRKCFVQFSCFLEAEGMRIEAGTEVLNGMEWLY